MSVKENLIAAKALIDTPEKWIKDNYYDGDGCYCASSAARMVDSGDPIGKMGRVHSAIRAQLPVGFPSIPDFNDHPDTTHADIMALFDRAISAQDGAA